MEKLNKQKLVDLVRKIVNVDGTEEEIDEWLKVLEHNVPHPEVSDLIFYSEKEMTPEQIVEIALAHKPIELGQSAESDTHRE